MAKKEITDDLVSIESDFANLARLAASGAHEDTRLLLARLVRKYRQQRPELASLLDQSLKASQTRSAGNAILRRGAPITEAGETPLPVDGDSRLALIRVSRTWAAAAGRAHVVPEDIRVLAPPVLCHRLLLDGSARFAGVTVEVEGPAAVLEVFPDRFSANRPPQARIDRVDAKKLVTVYRQYYPLFQKAYAEIAKPGSYFNDRLVEAIDNLLAAPSPADPVGLVQPKVLYTYADPALETRSSGQKILMRMGKANAEQVKAKLREIRALVASLPPKTSE